LAQFAQIDYQQEMAFVAENPDGQLMGEVRTWTDADKIQAEFSVLVSDQAQGMGLGYALMSKMIEYCRARGTMEMMGTVLADNKPMLKLAEKLGFKVSRKLDADVVEIILSLNEPKEEWQRQRLKRLRLGKK